jgi:rhamnosyltransferase
MKFAVVIVTFFPDERMLDSISILQKISDIENIYVIDNTAKRNKVIDMINCERKVTIVRNSKNRGIAYAQNHGLQLAINQGYPWALTLDQDSIVYPKMFLAYSEYIASHKCQEIGIICTDYIDVGTGQAKFKNDTPEFISETISSGSLINLKIFLQIGKMKEHYFIDQVDNEYCWRLHAYGYKIILLPGCMMEHRLGKVEKKRFFGNYLYIYNQSPIRTYYRTRNMILFIREYEDNVLRKLKIKALIKDFLRISFEKNKLKKYYWFIKGLSMGIKYKIEKKDSEHG